MNLWFNLQFKMKILIVSVVIVAVLPVLGSLGETVPEDKVLATDAPVVEIPDGKIFGSNRLTVDKNFEYSAYRGIPFAQPPVGDLRFASPVKNSKWTDYWNATEDANICIQGSGATFTGSEDCLYINVYTPKNAQNLPVMVWIYGGGFTGGDSRYVTVGPDYFLEEEVVFVSFNYRLGIFGFMSTEDQVVSGNWGLKDQLLALRWVKDNIQYFGGDSNRITIFGQSAGAAGVSYLLQMPKAQGLFQAAIIQSGTSENLWALATRARQAAFQVASNLGIRAVLSRTLLQRLRGVDAESLQTSASSVYNQLMALNPLRGLPWAPSIEVESDDAVFTKSSDTYLKSGEYPSKVPIMIGYTSNEAGHAHGIPEIVRTYLLRFDASSTILAPFSLSSRDTVRIRAANQVRRNFFNSGLIATQFDKVVKFLNADQFTRGILRMGKNVAEFVPVYFYVFGYMGEIAGENSYDGTGHAEDLYYLFRQYTDVYSAEDLIVRAKLIRLWTNFAKTYNPTPTSEALLDNVIWPTVNPASSNLDYVWLNFTISTDTNPVEEDHSFYDNLFNKYGEPPFTTY